MNHSAAVLAHMRTLDLDEVRHWKNEDVFGLKRDSKGDLLFQLSYEYMSESEILITYWVGSQHFLRAVPVENFLGTDAQSIKTFAQSLVDTTTKLEQLRQQRNDLISNQHLAVTTTFPAPK